MAIAETAETIELGDSETVPKQTIVFCPRRVFEKDGRRVGRELLYRGAVNLLAE